MQETTTVSSGGEGGEEDGGECVPKGEGESDPISNLLDGILSQAGSEWTGSSPIVRNEEMAFRREADGDHHRIHMEVSKKPLRVSSSKAERRAARQREHGAIYAAVEAIVSRYGGASLSSAIGARLKKESPGLYKALRQRFGGLQKFVIDSPDDMQHQLVTFQRGPHLYIAFKTNRALKAPHSEATAESGESSQNGANGLHHVLEKLQKALEQRSPQPLSQLANTLHPDELKEIKRRAGSFKSFLIQKKDTFHLDKHTDLVRVECETFFF